MRVLQIVSSLEIGGAEVLVSELLSIKDKLPFELYVVANKTGRLAEKLRELNCSVPILLNEGFNLGYLLKLRKFIIINEIDIVHAHDRKNAIYLVFLNFFVSKKLVFTIHGFSFGKSFLRYIIDKVFHRILFVSKILKTSINNNKNNKKYWVVYNGVNPEKFGKIAEARVFTNPKILKMGMVGNFKNSARDQLTVCRALKALKERGVPFQFIFVGEKSETQPHFFNQCYDYCKTHNLLDNVYFLGGRTDIPDILSQLDIFVYSSHIETFCLSLVEAMMAGAVVMTNDLPIFKEITENGKYATLFKTRNPNDLVTKIQSFITDPVPYYNKATIAAVYAAEEFSMEKHSQNLNQIYRGLLDEENT